MLGDAPRGLHPQLRAYVDEIPSGRVGRGVGVFERIGTPRRWLWPALALLARTGVIFPVWARDVPFEIENRMDGDQLRARRIFHLPGGDRVMIDAIGADNGRIVDRLGSDGALRAELAATIVDGALHLRSTRTRWRGIPIPFAPRVTLIERFDDGAARQHVALTLDATLIGRIYEYEGGFDYTIESAGEDA